MHGVVCLFALQEEEKGNGKDDRKGVAALG